MIGPGRIGPGRLVLVVGPSGAGKDTLISGAKHALSGNPSIVFPRRVVTRQSGDAEDHDTIDALSFDDAAARGAFCLWWEAHGLKYGIPVAMDADIAAGRSAVCNVSRSIPTQARSRYENVCVVMVTASSGVLQQRLAQRGRSSDGDLGSRLTRSSGLSNVEADVTIDNVHSIEAGVARLLKVLTSEHD